jgi:signal recognition particle subunit SRP54
VADALTGQDAVNLARNFDERVGITGLVLTRMDGDGRGGAALSMRAVTGKPIKLIGTGEKMDALWRNSTPAHRRPHPRHGRHRLAGRKGGREPSTPKRPQEMAKPCMKSGKFDLNDLADQLGRCRSSAAWAGSWA